MAIPVSTSNRSLVMKRALDGALILVGVVLLIIGWRLLQQTQAEVVLQQARVDAAPQAQSEYIQLQQSLKRYEDNVQQVSALLIPAEGVGAFVSQLERVAAAAGVTTRIPDVREEVKLDDGGNPITSTGPFQEVRLTVLAVGEPAALLRFMHAVEHLPTIVHFPRWRLTASRAAANRLIAPPPAAPAATPDPVIAARRAALEATIIVTTLKPL